MSKQPNKKKVSFLRRFVRWMGGRKCIAPDFSLKTPEFAQNQLFK